MLIVYNIDHLIKRVKFDSSIEIIAQYLIDFRYAVVTQTHNLHTHITQEGEFSIK